MSTDIERRIELLEQRMALRSAKTPMFFVIGPGWAYETIEQAEASMDPADLERGPKDPPIIFVHLGTDPAMQHAQFPELYARVEE